MKIVNIDGAEYINKFHYDKLLNKKEPKKEEIKKNSFVDKEFVIAEAANVCAIIPLGDISDKKVIETFIGRYKEVENPEVTYYENKKYDIDCFKILGSKYSKEYLDIMVRTAKAWCNEKERRIFMKINEEGNYEKDFPIIFSFDDKISFVLAPRIEND